MRLIEGVFPRPSAGEKRVTGERDRFLDTLRRGRGPCKQIYEIVKSLPEKHALLKRASSNHLQVRGQPLAHSRTLDQR